MADEAIEKAVKEVLSQIPDADAEMVREEFVRYHEEFIIPPQDAMRSVLRKVQSKVGIVAAATAEQSAGGIQTAPMKKVERLAELGAEDKNIVIEVKIITHNPVTQAVRGSDLLRPSLTLGVKSKTQRVSGISFTLAERTRRGSVTRMTSSTKSMLTHTSARQAVCVACPCATSSRRSQPHMVCRREMFCWR